MNNITLAVCAYNCEKYIEETLTCVINQTYQDFDLLIVNDCSTDNSVDLIKEFFLKNPRQYALVNFETNKGLAAGRHYVENNVETKYVLFVDADDCPCPTMVEKLYSKISSDEDLMAVGCYLEFMDTEGNKISGGQFLGDKTKKEFYLRAKNKKLIFLASNSIFNLIIAKSVGGRAIDGFFEGKPRYQDLCEDLDLWTRMSDLYVNDKAIVVVPEILLKYRKHDQGLSASSLNMIIRMRHIKTNLLRRRAGIPEQTFVEFYNSMSKAEMEKFRSSSKVADGFRNGVFLLRKGKVFEGVGNIFYSVWSDPKYFWQKIKSNSGLFK